MSQEKKKKYKNKLPYMSVRINFSDPVCIIHDKLKDGVCPELP